MPNAITIRNFSALTPTPPPAGLAAEITRLRDALRPEGAGKFSLSPQSAPSVEVRGDLARRAHEIDGWLRPAGADLTAREVASVLLTKPLRNVSAEEAQAVAAIYVADLQELPYFALAEACKAFRQNRAGDGKWAPTQGEIYIEAVRLVEAVAKERAAIVSILSAQIEQPKIGPERRAELAEEMRKVAAAMRVPTQDEMRKVI